MTLDFWNDWVFVIEKSCRLVIYRVVEYISYKVLRIFNDRGVYLSGLVHGEEKVEILKARGLEGNRSISS